MGTAGRVRRLNGRRAGELAGAAALVVAGLLAAALPAGGIDVVGEGEAITGEGRVTVTRPPGGPGGGGGGGGRPALGPEELIAEAELRFDAGTGGRCLAVRSRPGDPNSSEALAAEARIIDLSGRYPPCPGAEAGPAVPAAPSPAAIAELVWRDRMVLPRPEPRIAPGWAVAGKRAHLELGGPRSASGTFDALGATVTISATVTSFDVDWGDGTLERGRTGSGGPWPTGDVHHAYARAGDFDVVVVQRWRGTWQIGALGGVVRGTLSTEGRIEDLEVREVQAVRHR